MTILPSKRASAGFTLIELIIVIAIIGVLASMVLIAVNNARAKARDVQRKNDLHQVRIALESYYNDHRTYLVSGGGYAGFGQGYLSYQSGSYPKSVIQVLNEQGYLSVSDLEDPVQDPGYMIYLCDGGKRVAISATLEQPSGDDIAYIQTTCNGVGSNGTYTRYGKNYAVESSAR